MSLIYENQLLINCTRVTIHEDTKQKIRDILKYDLNWDYIIDVSMKLAISPIMFHNLRKAGVNGAIPIEKMNQLKSLYYLNATHNLFIFNKLNEILNTFNEFNIPVIILKGGILAQVVYQNIALRSMSDIDLLVEKKDLINVRKIMQNLGYVQHDGWVEEKKVHSHHLVPFTNQEKSIKIDIHWNLGMRENIFPIKMEDMWKRALKIKVFKYDSYMQSPEDLLIHLAIHLTFQHYCDLGLRGLCDIYETIQFYKDDINWDYLVEISKKYRVGHLVYFALVLTQKVYSAEIPGKVFDLLQPRCSQIQLTRLKNTSIEDIIELNVTKFKTPLARIQWIKSTRDKRKFLFNHLFPSYDEIAMRYSFSVSSKFIYFLYLIRPFLLIMNHGKTTLKLLFNFSRPGVKKY